MTQVTSPVTLSELLPCPFCGGRAEIEPKNWCGRDYIGVFCTECLLFHDSRKPDDAEAIAAWNTRATLIPAEEDRPASTPQGVDNPGGPVFADRWEVRPCNLAWDICQPMEPGATGVGVVATVFVGKEGADYIAALHNAAPSPKTQRRVTRKEPAVKPNLIERLRRKELGRTMFGEVAAGAFHDKLVNPDGPEAAARIENLEAALRKLADFPPAPSFAQETARAALSTPATRGEE